MLHNLILTFFFLLYGACGGICCHDGWAEYHSSCYLFGHDQTLTFTEAEQFCEQHLSHLVHIDDVHESNFLRQYLVHFSSDNWWIGLTDVVIEGEWRWTYTDTLATYLEWGPYEPDNTKGYYEEDCVVVYRNHDFRWDDVVCSRTFPPICETSVIGGSGIIG